MAGEETVQTGSSQTLKKRLQAAGDAWKSENSRTDRRGFHVLFLKEVADHLESKRFWILFLMMFLVSAASLRGALNSLSQAARAASSQGQAVSEFMFLKLFTTGGQSIYSFSTFLGFLGPIFGIMLGFDAINNEKAMGTLNRLAAQPIYRDTIINAKFLAGAFTVLVTVFGIGLWFTGAGILLSGLEPKPEEIARILIYLLAVVLYICLWLAIAVLFSTLSVHAATSALGCIALWLFLTLFLSLIASGLANLVYPTQGPGATILSAVSNVQLQTGISRISPYYLLSEITTVLMNPNVRSLNVMSNLMAEAEGSAIASYLPLGQSLLQIWAQITAMFAEAAVCFGAAYISFMNREIRA